MIQTIKENRKPIIISFTVAIVIFYSTPLLNFIGTKVVELLILMSTKYSNYFYQLMAKDNPNVINTLIGTLLSSLFVGATVGICVAVRNEPRNMEKEIIKLEKLMGRYDSKLNEEEESLEAKIAQKKKDLNKYRVVMIPIAIGWLSLSILITIILSTNAKVNSENVSFRNKVTILSVHLEDKEVKQLRAKWVQMKSKDDYDQINKTINDYYKKFSIPE